MRSEVQIFPGPPVSGISNQISVIRYWRSGPLISDDCYLIPEGAIAQLGERLLCKQEVVGSIPSGSTSGDPVDRARIRPNKKNKSAQATMLLHEVSACCVLSDIVKRRSFRANGTVAWPATARVAKTVLRTPTGVLVQR